jgi:hypothetical protein
MPLDAQSDSTVHLRFFAFEHVLVDAVEGMTAQVCLYSNAASLPDKTAQCNDLRVCVIDSIP